VKPLLPSSPEMHPPEIPSVNGIDATTYFANSGQQHTADRHAAYSIASILLPSSSKSKVSGR